MKKSQLRNIIRESIKELMTEQTYTQYHVYSGCTQSSGIGSNWGTVIPNQDTAANQSYASLLTPGDVLNNNNVLHNNLWQSPSPGTIIKFYTCAIGTRGCYPTCMTYVGPVRDTTGYNIMSYGMGANLTQFIGGFNDCDTCAADEGSTPIVYGCTDSNAFNYNSNATANDGSCDYGYRCGEKRIKPKLSINKCVPGTQQNPGNFPTLQDCLESDCELKRADRDFLKR